MSSNVPEVSTSKWAKRRFSGERHLRVDAGLRRLLRQPITLAEAPELTRGIAVDDHQPVEAEVHARLHEHGAVRHHHVVVRARRAEPLLGQHARMDDRVQALPRRRVRENDRAERLAVDLPVRVQDPRAERRDDFGVGGTARRDHLVRDDVEVESAEAQAREPAEDAGLPGGDATGQSHPQHVAAPLKEASPPRGPCCGGGGRS